MRNFYLLILTIALFFNFNSTQAQDKYNPWAVSVGFNAVDYYPVGQPDPQGDLFDEYFNANDHWNIFPLFSRIELSRYWSGGLSVSATASFNRINKFGTNVDPITRIESNNKVDDLSYYAFDGSINYSFKNILKSKILDPHIGGGGGYTWLNEIGSGTLNASLGLRYWFSERIALNLQSTYKHVFEVYGFRHFQHSASVTYQFGGKKDTDQDGISDDLDKCPERPGLLKFNGCPDSDGDGVDDTKDLCPNVAGLADFDGCPDSDGDGVPDKDDRCVNEPGLKTLSGCPDADNDAIPDVIDKCPNNAGPRENYGCPWPDTDGDGILDKDDKCPNEAGIARRQGCKPEINERDKKLLNDYARTILFSPGKSIIESKSKPVLQDIIKILEDNPEAKFSIIGHTDSIGSDLLNLSLSERRAAAVEEYLVNNGIDQYRLSSRGYGEEKPIATNINKEGRRKNRRVEIKLVY